MRNIIREILGNSGPIAKALGQDYEPRDEQIAMATQVNFALASKSSLMVEAGTGVGKSYAYLIPAIIRAVANHQRVVIATHTINLQEQLIRKDIPMLAETLGNGEPWGLDPSTAVPLSPVLVKGRGNYVSIRRLQLASQRQEKLFQDAAEKRTLHQIEDWAYTTADGSLQSLPQLERPSIWDRVQSDTDNCMGRKCPRYEQCFYQQARKRVDEANLLVCNHAVFFADLKLRDLNAGFLPPYHHVILDEAHTIEDVASDHFGLTLTESRIEHFLNVLYNTNTSKGYLPQLERQLQSATREVLQMLDAVVQSVHECQHLSRAFFEALHRLALSGKLTNGRIHQPAIVDVPLARGLQVLASKLRSVRETLKNDREEDRFELNAYAVRADAIAFDADVLINQKQSGCVYWLEGANASQRPTSVLHKTRLKLACSPIDVAPILKEKLFSKDLGIILTSATLATSGKHTHAKKNSTNTSLRLEASPARDLAFKHTLVKLGAETSPTMQLGSPFNYARQAELVIDLTLPTPMADARTDTRTDAGASQSSSRLSPAAFRLRLAERVAYHVDQTDGGAFVLFTSFSTLYAVADAIAGQCERERRTMLVQGKDGPPGQILERFKSDPRAVLLGAASFWQGVDVRGNGLRNVIITKLPFDPPDRPLIEARAEKIKQAGGDPFRDEALPRALLKFRQGFGRLIRSATDTGRVVVLDPRIERSSYGKLFLDALPPNIPVRTIRALGVSHDDPNVRTNTSAPSGALDGWEAGLPPNWSADARTITYEDLE